MLCTLLYLAAPLYGKDVSMYAYLADGPLLPADPQAPLWTAVSTLPAPLQGLTLLAASVAEEWELKAEEGAQQCVKVWLSGVAACSSLKEITTWPCSPAPCS